MARRTRIDIIADILSVVQEREEIKPTHLMYRANMSHNQMKPYLEELVEKSFIRKTKKKNYEYIVLTEKGHEILRKIKEMREFQKVFGV